MKIMVNTIKKIIVFYFFGVKIMREINSFIFPTVIRSIVSVVSIFIVAKAIGPKQIAQLTLYDYIVGITIGSLAATLCVESSISIYVSITAMITYALFTILTAKLTEKSIFFRKFFTGTPNILIYKGEIIEKNLIKSRYDINDLLSHCRINGYFNVADIEYAVFETNGHISFLTKEDMRGVVVRDIKKTKEKRMLFSNVIIDGKIIKENLLKLKKEEKWIINQLYIRGHKDIKEVLLMTLDEEDNINVYLRNRKIENENIFI